MVSLVIHSETKAELVALAEQFERLAEGSNRNEKS